MPENIAEPLLKWYDKNKRILPWRDKDNAYYTWVSEIMLQQTRVEAVKPYFQRFIQELPDVAALAAAPEERIIKLWEGLGYYSRVRNMQNPAYLVLSEARSMEVTSLLEQWSTGVNGFTTIHLDDVRKLPDRIQSMMNNVNDARRMENRIYRYVNLGLLIRKENTQDGEIRRYLDQLCFYAREDHENRIYMLVEDGELVSEEIPKDILLKLERAGIQEPFFCESFYRYRKEGR